MTRHLLTSGLFPVHFSGNGTTLHLLVSSFQTQSATVPFRVNVLQDDGSKAALREGELPVPGGQTGRVAIDGVDGRTLEVQLDLPTEALAPSLALVGTFAADGAESTLVWISPRGFVPRPVADDSAGVGPEEPALPTSREQPAAGDTRDAAQRAADASKPARHTARPAAARNALRHSVVWRPPAPRRSQRFTRRDDRRHPQRGGSNHA